MKDSFLIGVCMGVLVGAIIVHSCPKAKEIMKKGEKMLKNAENSIKECKCEENK